MERLKAVGHDSEGARKGGSNGVVPKSNVKGGGVVVAIIWHQDLGGDQVDAQGTDDVPPSGGTTDHGDNGEMRGRRRVGVPIGRRGNRIRGAPPHQGVHKEEVDEHSGEGGLLLHICTVHGGGADAGDKTVGAMVASRHGKRTGGIYEEDV